MLSKQILGVRIDGLTLDEARQKVREFLVYGQHKIFTPNPEFLVKAHKDEYFRNLLNSGDLNLCDGFGLQLASGIKRIPGVDFMIELCRIAVEQGSSVYLLGSGSDEVVKETANKLQEQFPMLKIAGYDKGPKVNECFNCHSERSEESLSGQGSLVVDTPRDDSVEKINLLRPDIIFVAFGMGKQEKWIYENIAKMSSVKIAMGVGGSFDYISGTIKRAPCWMRKIGLEWMYRLYKQPARFGRIFNATVKFIYLIFTQK